MTFTEAAVLVLRLVGKPLHYKEITDVAIERSLLSHVGKSPEVTMGSRLSALVKKAGNDNPLQRVKPGVFALTDWDEKTIEEGLADRTPALERLKKSEAEAEGRDQADEPSASGGDEAAAEEVEDPTDAGDEPLAAHRELDDDAAPPDEDEQHRAELSAGATEMFESEDDDDQPIFGGDEESSSESSDSSDSDRGEGKRRRRRRRGRGRRDEETPALEGGDDLPTYTVSDADPADFPASEEVSADLEVVDSIPSASLAGALEAVLSRYDRSKGPVSAQNLADALRRKLKGEGALNGPAVVSIAVAENLASERAGGIATFRVSGNKVGLTSWSLDRRAADRQRAFGRAADQMRESAVRAVADQLKQMPHRAVGELILVLLQRMGVSDVKSVRRPGAHGSELHLAGAVTAGGALRIPTAVMIRRDGKDIGRERVTELRGAMHHYANASSGWVISTGQILSGAREEALSPGGSPVTLTGRMELAELCVTHGVGVRVHRVEIPVVDVDLFESFQGQ